jgi:hypothetical protein
LQQYRRILYHTGRKPVCNGVIVKLRRSRSVFMHLHILQSGCGIGCKAKLLVVQRNEILMGVSLSLVIDLVLVLAIKARYGMAIAGLIDCRGQRQVVVLCLLFLCRSLCGIKWVR